LINKKATSYKELTNKFDISHPLMHRRIRELLSPYNVRGYADAKLLLENVSIDKILDELGNRGIINKLVDLGYFKI
jgi:hypothetical protein